MQKNKQSVKALIMSYSILGAFTVISIIGPILMEKLGRKNP